MLRLLNLHLSILLIPQPQPPPQPAPVTDTPVPAPAAPDIAPVPPLDPVEYPPLPACGRVRRQFYEPESGTWIRAFGEGWPGGGGACVPQGLH